MSARPTVALVSAASARDLDEDLPPIVAALLPSSPHSR